MFPTTILLCKGVFKYYISALEGGGGLTENAGAALVESTQL